MRFALHFWPIVLIASGGCVATTYEGPNEAPRSGAHLYLPPEVEAPAEMTGPEEIAARHILVMYRGSKNAPSNVVRSKEEAQARAQEAAERARKGEDFAQLAAEYSDEPGAAERGGDLGSFPRGVMVPKFEKAAFGLEPGAISDIIETDFGFHVIQRTE